MIVTCANCGATFDDALAFTYCPHHRFISDADATRKNVAVALLGLELRWAHDKDGTMPTVRIQAIGHNGMVAIEGFVGEFCPTLFKTVAQA